MNTLLIYDDPSSAEFFQSAFLKENLHCELLSCHEADLSADLLFQYDGVILPMLDLDNTVSLCNKINSVDHNKPVIVLHQRNNSMLDGMNESGIIENYFIPPFQFRVIVAELKFAAFRAREEQTQIKWTLRDLELDYLTRKVRLNNQSVCLRNKEFCLLHFLMQNIGRVLSRTDILENVWDRNALILNNTVDVHIAKLRKKIERTGKSKFIRTIPYAGYVLE